jgi:hypothetical protein
MRKILKKAFKQSLSLDIKIGSDFFTAIQLLKLTKKTVTFSHCWYNGKIREICHTTAKIGEIKYVSEWVGTFDVSKDIKVLAERS